MGAALPVPESFQLHHVLYADDGALFATYRLRRAAPSVNLNVLGAR
jgi:hypothetical protein